MTSRGATSRLVVALCLSIAVLAAARVERAGGWNAALDRVRWEYRLRVAPRLWPREPFTEEGWQRSFASEHYRFVRDLLDRRLLDGRTEQDVVSLLGAS